MKEKLERSLTNVNHAFANSFVLCKEIKNTCEKGKKKGQLRFKSFPLVH